MCVAAISKRGAASMACCEVEMPPLLIAVLCLSVAVTAGLTWALFRVGQDR